MRFRNWFKALEWTDVVFGEGDLRRFVLFECKYLFSIYINVWNVIAHDRFHTHAFSSFSFFLKGWYNEEELVELPWLPGKHAIVHHRYSAPFVRFIPRTNNHRMLKSSRNAVTVTIAGPWDRMWSESTVRQPHETRVLGWGRKVIAQDSDAPGGK